MRNASGVLIGVWIALLLVPSAKAQIDPFDSYGAISWDQEKLRLDNFAIQLQQDSDSIGYIIVYAGRRACVGEARDRALRAKKYLIETRSLRANRIKWIDGGFREELTTILQPVPRTAPELMASPTLKPSEVQIIKNCKPKKSIPKSAAMLFTGRPQAAEGWKGIVPLVTQRAEVEKILAVTRHDCETGCLFDIGNDRIFVRYAAEPCSKESDLTVPSGTVTEIAVYPGKDQKFSALKLDRRKFKKTIDPELHGYSSYDNEEQGIAYSVTEKGRVTEIHWWGTADRRDKLRCPSKP